MTNLTWEYLWERGVQDCQDVLESRPRALNTYVTCGPFSDPTIRIGVKRRVQGEWEALCVLAGGNEAHPGEREEAVLTASSRKLVVAAALAWCRERAPVGR